MPRTLAAILACLVTTIGCVTPQAALPFKDSEVFSAPIDKVWSAAVTAAQDMGMQISVSDRAGGLLGFSDYSLQKYCTFTNNMPIVLGRMAVTPSSFLGAWSDGYAAPSAVIKSVEGGTEVRFKVVFHGLDGMKVPKTMPSRGVLEQEFFSKIRANL